MNRTYFVYILASRSRALYTGVTNNLQRRLAEHREGLIPGFTSKYNIFRLVHFEMFADIRYAIAREKEIKAWRREKKVWLIERHNPTWEDVLSGLPMGGKQKKDTVKIRQQDQKQQTADPSPPFAKGRRPGSG